MRLLLLYLGMGLLGTLSCGCDLGHSLQPQMGENRTSDAQFLRVYFKYGYRDEVDTFSGTLTKDLDASGTVTVPFWFTISEQDTILQALDSSNFFALRDTLHPLPNVVIEPDPGPQVLRVQYGTSTTCLVWFYPPDQSEPRSEAVIRLWGAMRRVIETTTTYTQLPPGHVGYL